MFRTAVLLIFISVLPGCSAITSLGKAGAELDAYTLSAAIPPKTSTRNLHLVVALPTSAGALATDRILVKPTTLQAQYLPDGRWTDPTPVLMQTLLLASIQNSDGFLLVDRTGAGLMPDYTLMTELKDFQAEPAGSKNAPVLVRVGATMTLIRESDRSVLASRQFNATVTAASDNTLLLVKAFDAALKIVLTEAVEWTNARAN